MKYLYISVACVWLLLGVIGFTWGLMNINDPEFILWGFIELVSALFFYKITSVQAKYSKAHKISFWINALALVLVLSVLYRGFTHPTEGIEIVVWGAVAGFLMSVTFLVFLAEWYQGKSKVNLIK